MAGDSNINDEPSSSLNIHAFPSDKVHAVVLRYAGRSPKHLFPPLLPSQFNNWIKMKAPFALCALLLTACSTQPKHDGSVYGASVGIVNHTPKYIHSATVDGAGGANMAAWGAGIGNVCCAMVPRKWYPGMQMLVIWNMPEEGNDNYKEKMVEVEKYDEGGSIYMHFFPNDEVRVVVSGYYSWSPMHPIPAPVKPESQSVHTTER